MADPVFFLPTKDLQFLRDITFEAGTLFLREIEVGIINRDTTAVDTLYGEAKNIEFQTYKIRALVEIMPKKAKLIKFGLDEDRDLLVYVDVGTLQKSGEIQPQIGDYLLIEGERYKILETQALDYYAHQEQNFSFGYACNRYRERSIDDSVLVDESNPAGPTTKPVQTEKEWFPGAEES